MPFIFRHPIVGQDGGHRLAAQGQLAQRLQRRAAGLRTNHPMMLSIPPPQIARHGAAHSRIVVDRHQHRVGHIASVVP
jgi:hypothetical protein